MANISKKFNRLFNIASALFVVFSIDYILLFGAETILPGFVVKVFNLNFLLFGVLGLWLIIYLLKTYGEAGNLSYCGCFKYVEYAMLSFLLLVLIISLYRLPVVFIAVYAILAVVSFLALKNYLTAKQ